MKHMDIQLDDGSIEMLTGADAIDFIWKKVLLPENVFNRNGLLFTCGKK